MAKDFLRGAVQSFAGRALKNVTGNIRSGLLPNQRGGGGGYPKMTPLESFSQAEVTKNATKILKFPSDVDSGRNHGNHGHYMIFGVRKQNPPIIDFFDRNEGKGNKSSNKAIEQLGQSQIDKAYSDIPPFHRKGLSKEQFEKNYIDRAAQELVKNAQTIDTARRATIEPVSFIALYMPPSVSVQYGSDYTDTEIGAATNIAVQAYKQFQEGGAGLDITKRAVKSLAPELADGMIRMGLGFLSVIPGLEGAKEVIESQRGYIKAPQMELMFKCINRREFSYSFTMMPKNKEEADMVKKIVQEFKVNMLPEMTESEDMKASIRRLNIPNTFDITYMREGSPANSNDNLHRIGECVLQNVSVTYGGSRYKTYEDGTPIETKLDLSFKELDLITREKALQGY